MCCPLDTADDMEIFVRNACHRQLLGAGQDFHQYSCWHLQTRRNYLQSTKKSAEAGIRSFETFRRQWQIHAPEVVIIKPHSDVCYICDKHHEALLQRGGGHSSFAECRYSFCRSGCSREATTSTANGYLC